MERNAICNSVVTVRQAEASDRDRVTAIWVDRFGDSADFVERATEGNTVVVVERNGVVESFCVLIDCTALLAGNTHRLLYIYACATDRPFEGRGNLGLMIDYADRQAAAANYAATVIVPDNPLTAKAVARRNYTLSAPIDLHQTTAERLKKAVAECSYDCFAALVDRLATEQGFVMWSGQRWQMLYHLYHKQPELPVQLPYYVHTTAAWPDGCDYRTMQLVMPY